MEWRATEIVELRLSVANWIIQAREEHQRANSWRLIAFGGWLLAAILFIIPVIERWTK